MTCWGYNGEGQTDAPGGQYTALEASSDNSCGLRVDGAISCWGRIARFDPPEGRFVDMSVAGSHACAVGTDGTIVCWGNNNHGQIDAPRGEFVAVTVAGDRSCGLRTDGTIACWGYETRQPPPPGVQLLDRLVVEPRPRRISGATDVLCWDNVYVIEERDTLFSISIESGVSIDELIRINDIDHPDTTFVGDELCIPRR